MEGLTGRRGARLMRIAILGSGNVGGALGAALAGAGHQVVFGVRDPGSSRCRSALAAAPGSTAATPSEAVAGADLVGVALRPDAVPTVVPTLPPLGGTIVVDAMNRLAGPRGSSTSEDLVALLPDARVVKAFNTIGFENLATAHERTTPAAMFVAGDDPDAKAVVLGLAAELGFVPEDAGPLGNAVALEEMVRVWLALAATHGRGVGFAVSRG